MSRNCRDHRQNQVPYISRVAEYSHMHCSEHGGSVGLREVVVQEDC